MSDWKSRAQPVTEDKPATSSWKARAEVVEDAPTSLGQDVADTAMGIGQGAALGFGDEILGAGEAVKDVATGDTKLQDILKAYRSHQQENQKTFEDAEKRSPWLTGGGQLVGGIVPALLTGGGGEAATLAQLMKQGAAIGATAGLGGSKGTIEGDPTSLTKDAVFGSALGAIAPYAMKKAAGGASVITDKIAESPLAQKIAYAYKNKKATGIGLGSQQGAEEVERELRNAAGSITDDFLRPIKDSSKMYGQVLDQATENGSKLELAPDLIKKFKAAQDLVIGKPAGTDTPIVKQVLSQGSEYNPLTMTTSDVVNSSPKIIGSIKGQATPGRGGLTDEMESLLAKYGQSNTDPLTLNQVTQSLNPKEAKQLQLALRELQNSGQYADNGAVKDLSRALNSALDKALPEGDLSKINSIFGEARDVVAPLVNKGEIDPEFQTKMISDIDPELLGPKIKTYLQSLLSKTELSNEQGTEARTTFNQLMENLKGANERNQIQFADPNQIAARARDIGMKTAIRRGLIGEKSSDKAGLIKGVSDFVTGSPYRLAEVAGGAARKTGEFAESTQLPGLSRNLYAASDDVLKSAGERLNASGMPWLGQALHSALDNKSAHAKNAALFTIMQNPNARKVVFGSDDSETDAK